MAHENLFKIHIPEPCFEDWDKMTPNEQGSFCKVCSKTVVDFSKKSEDEIQLYIAANLDKKICGRFNVSQLEQETEEVPRLKINIEEPKFIFPSYLLPVMTPFRVSALALMLCASAMLSSCGNSEGNSGGDDKPLTGAIALVDSNYYGNNNNSDSLDINNTNIQGGISIKDVQRLNGLQDSSETCDPVETKTVGKIRVVQDTIKTDTSEVQVKGEIEPRRKMGIIKKLPDDNK
ncbi:MAG TPA: hypothetical protein PKE39_05940 [Ignavibacteria bacterium]|nr:hypothetical protein [Ignavibacteria bacterium]HMQ98546.1 hypothetical protein [Ignavibacteria bacterium]